MSTKTKVALTVAAIGVSLAGGGLAWQSVRAAGSVRRSAAAPDRAAASERIAATAAVPPGQDPVAAPAGAPAEEAQAAPATALARGKAPPRFVAAAPSGGSPPPAATVLGTLNKDDIREGIRAVVPAIKQCYDKLLAENPEASGHLTVKFTIVEQEGHGRISDATIVPQTRDGGTPELVSTVTESCILQVLAQASFTAPRGGPVIVTYPFVFTSGRPQ